MKTKYITTISLFTAISLIFGYIETLFPIPLPIPGIKLGLGNIVILLSLYILGKRSAICLMFLKVTVSALLFFTPVTFIYSLSGGIASVAVMLIMHRFRFNIQTISIGGGIFHNLAQLLCAVLILGNINVLYYSGVLIASGAVVGFVIGIVSKIVLKHIKSYKNKA